MIWLDLDGVLVDFVPYLCGVHGIPNPYDLPINYGIYEVAYLAGMTETEFFKPTDDHRFWLNVPKTRWADALVARASYGHRVGILTKPTLSEFSWSGKLAWVRKWYPSLKNQVRITPVKAEYARPGSTLVDDNPAEIAAWMDSGGMGVLWPGPWNDCPLNEQETLECI